MLYNAQPTAETEVTPLLEEDLLLVQRRPVGMGDEDSAGPIALKDVAQLRMVIPSRPNAVRMQLESEMGNIGCRLKIALEIDGVPAILDLVADGAGSAVLTRNAVANAPRPSAYQVRTIVSPALRTKVAVATSSLRPATLTQKATLELLKRTVRQVVQNTQHP